LMLVLGGAVVVGKVGFMMRMNDSRKR